MELRQYWHIIWKRIWIPILLVSVVAIISILTNQTPPTVYTSSLRFNVGVSLQNTNAQTNEDTYFAWLSSEHLADDLSEIVSSQVFAEDVNRRLTELGSAVQIFPGSIDGVTFAEKRHRILQLNLSWDNPDELIDIGAAIVLALEQDSPKYFAQFGTPDALATIIDKPLTPVPVPTSLTQRLDLPIRLILALLAGIALTFLLDYLDTTVRNASELEALEISVLGEVPKGK